MRLTDRSDAGKAGEVYEEEILEGDVMGLETAVEGDYIDPCLMKNLL